MLKLTFPICLGILLTLHFLSYGQSIKYIKTSAGGINLAFVDFKGAETRPCLALHLQNNLSKRLDYCITLAGSFLQSLDDKSSDKKKLLLENDFALQVRLHKSPALFNPYVLAGLGWSHYDNHYNIYIPTGIGFQVNVTPDFFLLVNSQYRVAVTTSLPGHFFHSIGIAGAINRKKIGITPSPSFPPPIIKTVNADTDGDGIEDKDDSCRLVAGGIKYYGCPLPDRDHDGIEDTLDKCPDKTGEGNMSGCPALPSETKQQISIVATKIFFETGSYQLMAQSHMPLNELVEILKDNDQIKLFIEGHTDNAGTAGSNQLLSENRAKAVCTFLVNGGIDARRLQYRGYGQNRPIADNITAEGRSKNRRVELKVL